MKGGLTMPINPKTKDALDYFFANPTTKWTFGNKILYDMCSQNPSHSDADIIVGKLWLIGRSYAAAIERRKGGSEDADDFYYEVVAPKMLEIGSELDARLERLRGFSCISEDNLDLVLQTHKFLMEHFFEITSLEKRSLASKYLHFHCPSMFYIYDSRANQAIRKYVKLDKQRVYKHYPCGCDIEYADFCVRMIELKEWVQKKYDRVLTPRELDNFLLYY